MTTAAPSTPSPRPAGAALWTVMWGLFCACSWTWIIGMYLPRICLSRWGLAGFLAFAIPNVLGCAGFGYVLRTRARSERMVAEHTAATTWFSVITVGYHLLFATLFVTEILPATAGAESMATWNASRLNGLALGAMALLFGGGWVLSMLGNRGWLVVTALVYAISITVFTTVLGDANLAMVEPSRPPTDLLFLTPILIFGFGFCPYFDLTFHRAVQHAPSHHAFAVFGATFAVMIVMTCAVWFRPVTPLITPFVLAHLVAQATFTVGAHLREIRERAAADGAAPSTIATYFLVPWILGASMLAVRAIAGDGAIADDWYLRYMAFYGLVFPLYALVFIGPFRTVPRTAATLRRYGIVVLLAAPIYEAAWIHHHMWLLIFVVPLFAVARRRSRA